jgi:hypothetical protein
VRFCCLKHVHSRFAGRSLVIVCSCTYETTLAMTSADSGIFDLFDEGAFSSSRSQTAAQATVLFDNLSSLHSGRFCYYICLKTCDRLSFVTHLIENVRSIQSEVSTDESSIVVSRLCQGGIALSTWIAVMESCASAGDLCNEYIVYCSLPNATTNAYRFRGRDGVGSMTVELEFSNSHLKVLREYNMDLSVRFTSYGSEIMMPYLLAFGNSIPSEFEHEQLIQEFRQSPIVARMKNNEGKNNALLDEKILMDVLQTLKQKLTSRFSYLRCLEEIDQPIFAEQLVLVLQRHALAEEWLVEEVLARLASGGISLELWIQVMELSAGQGLLRNSYVLYRRAYWGENSNDFSDTTMYSFYHCKVKEFFLTDGAHREGINILFDGYGHLSCLSYWFLNPSQCTDPDRKLPPVVVY